MRDLTIFTKKDELFRISGVERTPESEALLKSLYDFDRNDTGICFASAVPLERFTNDDTGEDIIGTPEDLSEDERRAYTVTGADDDAETVLRLLCNAYGSYCSFKFGNRYFYIGY